MRVSFLISFALLILWMSSCKRQEIEPRDTEMGFEYYPLKLGGSWTYTIDSLVFDPAVGGTLMDTLSGWAQELVVDTFYETSGQLMYRIERYERKTSDEPWQIRKVYAMGIDSLARQAIRLEDNLRFVPLIFPAQPGKAWDGNRFLSQDLKIPVAGEAMELFNGWDYLIESKEAMYSVGAFNFFDVLTVRQANSENLIELRRATEAYAKNIGLVYREWRLLDTQCTVCCNGNFEQCEGLPWEQKAERGFILRQQLVSWQ